MYKMYREKTLENLRVSGSESLKSLKGKKRKKEKKALKKPLETL